MKSVCHSWCIINDGTKQLHPTAFNCMYVMLCVCVRVFCTDLLLLLSKGAFTTVALSRTCDLSSSLLLSEVRWGSFNYLTCWTPPNLNVLAWNCYLQFDVPSTFHPPRRMKQEMLIVEEKAPTIFTRSHASLMLRFQMWEHVQSTSFLLLLEKCGNLCTDHVNTRTQTAGACSTGQVFFLLVFWTREEFLSAYL